MRVKVAGTNYEVVREKGLAAGNGIYGDVNYITHRIRIDEDLSPTRVGQTLIHELLHAVFHEAGYNEQDEDVINRVANVLYQVLTDNDINEQIARAEREAVVSC